MLTAFSKCGLFALVACITGGGQAILACLQRGKIRRRLNINGNGCTDCLAACCCMPCALTQEGG